MRSVALAVLGLLAAACGDAATVERLSSKEALDGIDVPTIGTVGDFPDPAHRHVVNVTADGRIVVEGRTLTFAQLGAELERRGALSGEPVIGGTTMMGLESFVLRADRGLPWGATTALYKACGGRRFPRVFFAVRHEGDGVEGAVAAWLPRFADLGRRLEDGQPRNRTVTVNIGDGDGSPARLHASLAGFLAANARRSLVDLDADPALPTGEALALFDAVLRAGATDAVPFGFDERRRVSDDFDAEVRRPRTATPRYSIRIEPPDAAPIEVRPMPEVPRARGRLAGITWR